MTLCLLPNLQGFKRLGELEAEAGGPLRRISLPIADMGIPDAVETMHSILRSIRESRSHAPAVYVHCWGGIGRTGMVVGCWFRECGYDPEAALAHVQHLYAIRLPVHPKEKTAPRQEEATTQVIALVNRRKSHPAPPGLTWAFSAAFTGKAIS